MKRLQLQTFACALVLALMGLGFAATAIAQEVNKATNAEGVVNDQKGTTDRSPSAIKGENEPPQASQPVQAPPNPRPTQSKQPSAADQRNPANQQPNQQPAGAQNAGQNPDQRSRQDAQDRSNAGTHNAQGNAGQNQHPDQNADRRDDQHRTAPGQRNAAGQPNQPGQNHAGQTQAGQQGAAGMQGRDGRDQRGGNARIDAQQLGAQLQANNNQLSVQNVAPNSAAAQIGLRSGDEIVSLGGQNVANQDQFHSAFEQQWRNTGRDRNGRIPLVVRRNGAMQTLYWTNAALASAGFGAMGGGYRAGSYQPGYQYSSGYRGESGPMNPNGAFLGVDLDQRFGDRAVVSRVHEGSAAAQSGLQPGDTIWSIDDDRIRAPQELAYIVAQRQPGASITIHFVRPGSAQAVLGQRGSAGQTQTGTVQQDQFQQNQQGVIQGQGQGQIGNPPPAPGSAPAPSNGQPAQGGQPQGQSTPPQPPKPSDAGGEQPDRSTPQ